MKQRNRVKRLETRQQEYDRMIKKDPELALSFKRPGSMNK